MDFNHNLVLLIMEMPLDGPNWRPLRSFLERVCNSDGVVQLSRGDQEESGITRYPKYKTTIDSISVFFCAVCMMKPFTVFLRLSYLFQVRQVKDFPKQGKGEGENKWRVAE